MIDIEQIGRTIFNLNCDLERIESHPVPIDDTERNAMILDGKTLQQWIDQVKAVLKQVNEQHPQLDSLHLEKLQLHLIALEYRAGIVDDVPTLEDDLLSQLEPIIQRYKARPDIYPGGDGELTSSDRHQLDWACRKYPLFVQHLIHTHNEREIGWSESKETSAFVKWALRSNCSVGVFVKMPSERQILANAHLDKRSGAVDKTKGIRFSKMTIDEKDCKVLTIRIDGQHQPIVHETEIALQNLVNPAAPPYRLTIGEMIQQCKAKTFDYGNVEYLEGGLQNWNSIHLGSYNPTNGHYDQVDLTADDFLEKLPVVKTVTKEELQKRYPEQKICEDGEWGLGIKVTRATPTFKIRDNHAFIELVLPLDNGTFKILPIGLQPVEIPGTALDKLSALADTLPANLHFPDECMYLDNRQQGNLFFRLDAEEKLLIKEEIKDQMTRGRDGNLFFQPMGDNCAYFIQKIFNHLVTKKFDEMLKGIIASAFTDMDEAARKLLSKQALKQFDDGALDELLDGIADWLIDQKNSKQLENLIDVSLAALTRTLFQNRPDWADSIQPSDTEELEELKTRLKEFLKLVIESHTLFKLHLLECDYESFLKPAVDFLRWIPWEPLRNFLASAIIFLLLGSWRGLAIEKKVEDENGHYVVAKRKSLSQHRLAGTHTIYLPASFFHWLENREARQEDAERHAADVLKLKKKLIPD